MKLSALKLTTLFLILTASQTFSQEKKECPCCSSEYSQFDYWVGEWDVFDTTGTKVGSNIITKLEDGCLLKEQWTSTGKHTGTSYNFYNRTDKSWNQIWVDNQGTVLDLKGELINGAMTLKSSLVKNKDGENIYHRIAWHQQKDGSVMQVWGVVHEDGKVLSNLFKGQYKKVKK